MLLPTFLSIAVSLLPPVEDAVQRPRLEEMLRSGDERLVVATFRRHPAQVLPFVDGYLEGGLAMIEQSGDRDGARASFRSGLQFAELATEAFGDAIFSEYASAFGSWSPEEQRRFRAGQAAYKAGRGASSPAAALERFEESLTLARSLHDRWGEAMALGGVAGAHLDLGDPETARDAAQRAANLYRRLKLHGSEASALLLLARALEAGPGGRAATNVYGRAWQIVSPRPEDDELRCKVRDLYAASLEEAGDTARATAVREGGATSRPSR